MPFLIANAQDVVLSHAPAPLPSESRDPLDALGSRLAVDVVAERAHPPFPAAIKDGFAISASAAGGARTVVRASRAGASAEQPALGAHEAAYVTTGAPMPPGTDAVLQIESACQPPDSTPAVPSSVSITFSGALSPGAEVRAIGSDIALGATVLRAHDRVGPAEVGLLATVGCRSVRVFRRPRVGVLSTGDELLDALAPADTCAPSGRIYDSNRPLLLAAATALGAHAVDLGIADDKTSALEAKLDAALSSGGPDDVDVLVCSGGVSMGDRDLVKPLLSARGTVHFGKVLMKPGKPLTFATVPRPLEEEAAEMEPVDRAAEQPTTRPPLLVFGLPGNPAAALVS